MGQYGNILTQDSSISIFQSTHSRSRSTLRNDHPEKKVKLDLSHNSKTQRTNTLNSQILGQKIRHAKFDLYHGRNSSSAEFAKNSIDVETERQFLMNIKDKYKQFSKFKNNVYQST